MWVRPLKAIELNQNVLVILVPGQIFYEHIESHYAILFKKTLRRVLGTNAKIAYRLKTDSAIDSYKSQQLPYAIPALEELKKESSLNLAYTFETFKANEGNFVARSAGETISKTPRFNCFNPFLICAKTGLGKTHLAHAIGNEIRKTSPQLEVLFLDAREFIRQFDEYHHHNAIHEFISFYLSIDVLIMDDLQFLNHAKGAQEALLTIFNHLHRSGKQMIFTSGTAPRDLQGLEIRLLSRLNWGMVAEFDVPADDTLMKIIQRGICGVLQAVKSLWRFA